jgi:hypothetical protein
MLGFLRTFLQIRLFGRHLLPKLLNGCLCYNRPLMPSKTVRGRLEKQTHSQAPSWAELLEASFSRETKQERDRRIRVQEYLRPQDQSFRADLVKWNSLVAKSPDLARALRGFRVELSRRG